MLDFGGILSFVCHWFPIWDAAIFFFFCISLGICQTKMLMHFFLQRGFFFFFAKHVSLKYLPQSNVTVHDALKMADMLQGRWAKGVNIFGPMCSSLSVRL